MFAGGALAAALAAALGAGLVVQVLVFAVVSTALILVVRPLARRSRSQLPALQSGVDALPGREAVVLERVDRNGGRIKLAGEVWSARALDTDDSYEAGSRVHIAEIDGATAVVMG